MSLNQRIRRIAVVFAVSGLMSGCVAPSDIVVLAAGGAVKVIATPIQYVAHQINDASAH